MIVEQRKHSRFLPHENTFAAVGREFTKVGRVKDISIGGLAIEYIAGEATSSDPSQVDIFLTGRTFHLYNLPCRLLYDIEIHVPHVNNRYVKILTTKRCGIQFKDLDDDELTQLLLYLDSYTVSTV